MKLEEFGMICATAAGIYGFVRWLMEAERSPDPWGADIEKTVNTADAVPVCPHCLAPQEHNGWFCPECGATVGPYANYLPFVYPFSVGDAFRAGASSHPRRGLLVTLGYILVALGYFSILAPIYLLLLFLNFHRQAHEQELMPDNPLG
jgi:hypothetical protein